ncbi:PREDICTED: zinc finger BED domain-containing protein 1-like [Nanorana parkeri]|uniref:zinc finger BED domain-containing protein 1-like n=1 Tax=Nanorana parkeri TaxID=125878 RepID=UPI000854377C|nr:PREDICTED: zinc finger BED domain-containing protein 1-like [Nanorana parkeri]
MLSITSGSTGNLKRHLKTQHPTVSVSRKQQQQQQRKRSRSPSVDEPPASNETSQQNQPHSLDCSPVASPACIGVSPGNSDTASNSLQSPASPATAPQFQSPPSRFVGVLRPIAISKKRSIDIQLLKMICKEYHPFSIVDDEEFKTFVRLLNHHYHLPSCETLTDSLLPSVYNEMLVKVKAELSDAQAVCITCDGWTNINNISCYALTAHYIDKATQPRSCFVDCSEFSARHTSANIASWMNEVLETFSIRFKICAVVTDDAADMKAAAADLNLRHIACFARGLNAMVKEAMSSSINELVDKAKGLVQYFTQSSSALAKLHEVQTSLNKDHLELQQDVPTSWNSTYDMLERLVETREPIVLTLALLGSKEHFIFEAHEWEAADHSVKLLAVFNDVTKEISSETNVSLSKTSILSRIMSRKVAQYLESNPAIPDSVCKLGKQLAEGLSKRFGNRESNEMISQCIILDPRFKKEGFGDEAKYRLAYQALVGKVRVSVERQVAESNHQAASQGQSSSPHSVWGKFDASLNHLQARQDPMSEAVVEIDNYIKEAHLPRTSDPFHWWELRKFTYPNLYSVVVKRLCIPANSVPCERIFSKAGQVCAEKRSRLTSDNMKTILFVNNNLHLV